MENDKQLFYTFHAVKVIYSTSPCTIVVVGAGDYGFLRVGQLCEFLIFFSLALAPLPVSPGYMS